MRARQSAFRQRRMQMSDALKAAPCVDCGGSFPPECMDWDHRPGTRKVKCVGLLLWGSWDKVLREVAKCDLVCANCHRIRTKARGKARRRSRKARP